MGQPRGIPPWHVWGSTQILRIRGNGNVTEGQQLASINYARPDTWSFFMTAKIIQIDGVLPGNALRVEIALTVGAGRSATELDQFQFFDWTAPSIFTPSRALMCSSVEAPADNLNRTGPNVIEWIPAQTLQCVAIGFFQGSVPANTSEVLVSVSAYFAPRSHLRPEWFRNPPVFNGGEG